MSGHSHWAGIKHRKGLNDAKRAQVFTKLAKPIVIAARDGGGNPETNFKLRLAIDKAREFNMPKDNIERAIKRGTGELGGEEIQEIVYEATAPGGIMMLIKTTTDNRNRTVSEIKSILVKSGAKFGEAGSVMWNFDQVGRLAIDTHEKDIERLEMIAIENGAEDIEKGEQELYIFTKPQKLQQIQEKLVSAGLRITESGLAFVAKSKTSPDEKSQKAYENLLETLDNQDDVEEIYDNL